MQACLLEKKTRIVILSLQEEGAGLLPCSSDGYF